MFGRTLKVAAVVLGGPVFAFTLLSLGCSSSPPLFGEYCSPHLFFGPLAGFTLLFWFVIPASAAIIRVRRGSE